MLFGCGPTDECSFDGAGGREALLASEDTT